ncbi:hypothetical protein SteCoe_4656 [Stentor coeruleus]|uniref:Cyclic nucleotide-binding domain-containing protein n=1 Tax=Stentor coeruleus TaxID=5963 RepID=A0A1R2CU21_9CILI|nr:hypothetical protein SteCoe_4656 [Stentor coeruleus]
MNANLLSNLKKICIKSPKDRTSDDIEQLYQLTKYNKVFSELSSVHGPNLHKTICKHLKYEFCDAGKYLFEYGSEGNKFYVILTGKVGIEIPKKDTEIRFQEVVELTDGGCFGELALESDKPRQASIKCKTPCHFAYLLKNDYQVILLRQIRDRRNAIVNFLYSLPLFRNFTKGFLTKISYSLKEKSLKKGQVLYQEGEFSDEFYMVKEGEIGLFRKLKAKNPMRKNFIGTKSFEVNIANIGKGEIFGDDQLINKLPRASTSKCISDKAIVYYALKDEFTKLIRNEDFWEGLKEKLQIKHEDMEKRLLMTYSIREAIPLNKNDIEDEEIKGKIEKEHRSFRRSMTNLNIQPNNFRSENGKIGNNTENALIKRTASIVVEVENDGVLTRRNTLLTTPDNINNGHLSRRNTVLTTPDPINYRNLDKKPKFDFNKLSIITSDTHVLDFEHTENPIIGYNKRNLVHFSSKSSFDNPTCIMEEDLEEPKNFKKSQTNSSSTFSLYKPQTTSSQRISVSQQTKDSSCLSRNLEYAPNFLMSTKNTDSNRLTPMGFPEKPSKRILLTKTPRINDYKSPLGTIREKRSGVALYNMNAFPIYLALWQQND